MNRRMRDGRAMWGVQKGIHYFCLLWPPAGSGKDGNRGLRGEGQQVNIIQAHLINKKKQKKVGGGRLRAAGTKSDATVMARSK